MIEIKNLKELNKESKYGSISSSFTQYLEKYFRELHKSLADGIPIDKFDLEEHGHFVILSVEDDYKDLEDVGLNKEDGGLLGSCPEFVNLISLADNVKMFEVGILYNNEYMMIFFCPFGLHKEVDEFLSEYLTEDSYKEAH